MGGGMIMAAVIGLHWLGDAFAATSLAAWVGKGTPRRTSFVNSFNRVLCLTGVAAATSPDQICKTTVAGLGARPAQNRAWKCFHSPHRFPYPLLIPTLSLAYVDHLGSFPVLYGYPPWGDSCTLKHRETGRIASELTEGGFFRCPLAELEFRLWKPRRRGKQSGERV